MTWTEVIVAREIPRPFRLASDRSRALTWRTFRCLVLQNLLPFRSMRKTLLVVFTCLLLSLPRLQAAAQKFQPKTIQFNGAPELSDADLLAAAGLKSGDILTTAEMNEHAKRLMDSGVFDTMSYKFDGQDMVFTLVPATLYPIRIDNLPLTPGPELETTLHAQIPLFHGRVPSQGTLLDDVKAALERLLSAEGITAKVTSAPYADPKARNLVSAINFTIDSPPVTIGEIHFIGASTEVLPLLRSFVKTRAAQSFDTSNTASSLQKGFAETYQNLGYAAAAVDVERDGNPVVAADAIRVPFVAKINEGHVYKLGTIQLPPDSLLTQSELNKELASQTNMGAGSRVRWAWHLLEERYKSKGYLDFFYLPRAHLDEVNNTANYTVELTPGPVYHLGILRFDNVSDAMRAELMRNWQMLPGDTFDENYLESFVAKAETTDPVLHRSLVGVTTHYDVRADPTSHVVNVAIRLEKP